MDSDSFVSVVSSLNSKIKNLPNAISAALSGTIRDNYDSGSNIGGINDISLSAINTMFAALSLRRLDFLQGHGSFGSYSKATDSISAALRGGREHCRKRPVSVPT